MKSLVILLLLFAQVAFAESVLKVPEGEVILELTGKISVTNEDEYAVFDEAMVNALPQATINTNNHVSKVVNKYRGPKFYDLLASLGHSGTKVVITAWDDYVAEIDIADLKKYGVILATHENGKRLTIEDKGPTFTVFPFSDYPEIRRDDYYNKSIWQIRTIAVE